MSQACPTPEPLPFLGRYNLIVNPRSFLTRAHRRLEAWPPLRRLDHTAFGRALLFGLLSGLLAGAAMLGLPDVARLPAAAVVIALAGALAWSARPVGIWQVAPLLDMVALEGGSFMMGSPVGEPYRRGNETPHRVTVSALRVGRTAITRAQYGEVMEIEQAPGSGQGEHPVTEVSWFDAVAMCNRLSRREQLPPCYEIEGDQVSWVADDGGYRLATEAEWEYACRAGSTGRWSFGDEESALGEHAWFYGNSGDEAHKVAAKKPNPWGLYDMHGNVWEWCWDAFGEYDTQSVHDPRGPGAPGASRVLRGGAFFDVPGFLRSAFRGGDRPELSYRFIGFRCVRRARRQP